MDDLLPPTLISAIQQGFVSREAALVIAQHRDLVKRIEREEISCDTAIVLINGRIITAAAEEQAAAALAEEQAAPAAETPFAEPEVVEELQSQAHYNYFRAECPDHGRSQFRRLPGQIAGECCACIKSETEPAPPEAPEVADLLLEEAEPSEGGEFVFENTEPEAAPETR